MLNPSVYRSLTSLIQAQPLSGKRIFLRADLNVPLIDGIIQSDYRLEALLPTLDLLIRQNTTIVIATHIGRPSGYDQAVSTQHLIAWFAHRGYDIGFAADVATAYELSMQKKHQIIMLENLRFFPGEKARDATFAQQLARLGDYYVSDSFATLHRNDTSITLVPYLFAHDHRCVGLLVIRELTQLYELLKQPKRPFILVIGGGKVADKIPLIMNLLDTVDTILLCPAIVFSFLYALGLPTGKSLIDTESKTVCLALLEQARIKNVQVLFPTDYYVTHDSFTAAVQEAPVHADALKSDMVGITIGPDTIRRYTTIVASAGSILVNGLMGEVNRPPTLIATVELFKALSAHKTALRLIGGGDSVAAVELLGFQTTIGSISTGGGSMLALLGGEQLPGLQPFLY